MMVNLTMASHLMVMCSLIRNCDTYSFMRYMVVQSVPSVCLQVNLITARFARAFSLLLSSGMDLATALDSVSIIFGNVYIQERFSEAAQDTLHGVSLTNALQRQKIFPQMLLQMLSVGEKTASLEDVLRRSCKFFDEQLESSLNSITTRIQPVMLLIMGVVIGTLFLAVYAPMLSIMNGLG